MDHLGENPGISPSSSLLQGWMGRAGGTLQLNNKSQRALRQFKDGFPFLIYTSHYKYSVHVTSVLILNKSISPIVCE